MLREAPSPNAVVRPAAARLRSPYFFQDPLRLSAIACVVLLMLIKDPPVTLTIFAVGISQFNALAMVIDLLGSGWSSRFGRRARTAVLANSMAMDWTNMSVCTIIGAMLLMRFFAPPAWAGDLVGVLGLLALGIALVPDMRLCRMIMPADAAAASGELERGYFFRDPVKLGGLAALMIVCVLDQRSLLFIFASMVLLQANAVLLLVDKYLGELESSAAGRRYRSLTLHLVLARDGQRLLITLLPMVLVPLRLLADDLSCRWAAGIAAGLIVIPDLVRLFLRLVGHLWGANYLKTDTRRLRTVRNVYLGGV